MTGRNKRLHDYILNSIRSQKSYEDGDKYSAGLGIILFFDNLSHYELIPLNHLKSVHYFKILLDPEGFSKRSKSIFRIDHFSPIIIVDPMLYEGMDSQLLKAFLRFLRCGDKRFVDVDISDILSIFGGPSSTCVLHF